MRTITGAVSVLGLALLGACLDEDPALGSRTDEVIKCPSWGCGGNSPIMGPWSFHELDEAGAFNSSGIRIIDMYRGAEHYEPDVIGSELTARSPRPAKYPTLTGTDLAGMILELETPSGVYLLHVRKVSQQVVYWVGTPTPLYSYELEYESPTGSGARALCHNPPDESAEWPLATEALLFTGDRYDSVTKQLVAYDDVTSGTWFNIGCAASVIAKSHLQRYTWAGAELGFMTEPKERQALLKMYTADFCGTGEAFTREGEPLLWANRSQTISFGGPAASYEAWWNEDGAMCLDTHRLDGDPAFPDVVAEVMHACDLAGHSLPPCADLPGFPGAWPASGRLLSANP